MNKNDQLAIATIRSLCIDTINKANSGHPGMALGSAPALYTLFTKHLVATPLGSKWYITFQTEKFFEITIVGQSFGIVHKIVATALVSDGKVRYLRWQEDP